MKLSGLFIIFPILISACSQQPTVKKEAADSHKSITEIKPVVKDKISKPTVIKKSYVKPEPVIIKKTEHKVKPVKELTKTTKVIKDKKVVKPTKNIPKKNIIKSESKNSEPATVIKHESEVVKNDQVVFTEDSLPLKFGSIWTLDKTYDLTSNKTKCLLTSTVKKFYDGYDNTSMVLQLSTTALLVKTTSNIDLTYPDTGLYIDQNTPISFRNVFKQKHVLINNGMAQIISQLIKGTSIEIKLGFWPTWPQTKTSTIGYNLNGLDQAYLALKQCEKL